MAFLNTASIPLLLLALGSPDPEQPGVLVAMVVPPEGPAFADCREKLDIALKDVQWWYSCQMEAHGHGAKTFSLELDDEGRVVVHTVQLSEPLPPTADTTGRRSAVVIAAERVLGDPRERDGAVMLLAYNGYYWSDEPKLQETPMGYGANGRWAHLTGWHLGGVNPKGWTEDTPISKLPVTNCWFSKIATRVYQASDRDGARSVGERCSVSHGVFLHEMGHSFGLHHPGTDTKRFYGDVMTGDGFWNARGNFVESIRDQWCCLTPDQAALLDKNPLFRVRDLDPPSSGASRATGMRGALGLRIRRDDFASIEEMGTGFTVERLGEGERSHANRDYVWTSVPAALEGCRFTRTSGGETAHISIRIRKPGRIHVATAEERSALLAESGWQILPITLSYASTDGKRVYPMYLYFKDVARPGVIDIPQREWTGTIVIASPKQ